MKNKRFISVDESGESIFTFDEADMIIDTKTNIIYGANNTYDLIKLLNEQDSQIVSLELEKREAERFRKVAYECDHERQQTIDELNSKLVEEINLSEKRRQIIEKLTIELNEQKAMWNELKEWIEKDHDWNLERGNNDCALGQRWVLDKMQDLEKGEKE